MSSRPLVFLSAGCICAFALAIWAYAAGLGILAAFAIYSLGGTALVIAFTALSFIRIPQEAVNIPNISPFPKKKFA